jgi:hypothetical protein
MILCISRICFYFVTYISLPQRAWDKKALLLLLLLLLLFVTYITLFVSLLYSKNIAHKYFRHLANNIIQIYFA